MNHRLTVPAVKRTVTTLICAFALIAGLTTFAGDTGAARTGTHAKSGVLKGNPSKKTLATEFLRLLKAKDKPGLKRFFDPAFLLQRGDGSYLNKKQYLANPSIVDAFKVRNIVTTRSGAVRVVRFEANTSQIVNGKAVAGGWIPRLSTFVKSNGVWRLISHANFLLPPAT